LRHVTLDDKKELEQFLIQDRFLHIYSLGDLDDFFWPYTRWYGLKEDNQLKAVVLIYSGMEIPTLLALSRDEQFMITLLETTLSTLPERFYAHVSPGCEAVLTSSYQYDFLGKHYKMALTDKTKPEKMETGLAEPLSSDHIDAINTLYRQSYPENWFDPRMLETGQYFGIWEAQRLVSIAGIHVYSPHYRVAALGNITTHGKFRKKGYGRRVTGQLCRSLLSQNIEIGLNVKADNRAAIGCYQTLGFEKNASYGEYYFKAPRV
jgi:ribosomal protein S18 acetylase RimI-like enzyme